MEKSNSAQPPIFIKIPLPQKLYFKVTNLMYDKIKSFFFYAFLASFKNILLRND